MTERHATIEAYTYLPYRDWARSEYGKFRFFDYLAYDKEGFLWLNGDVRFVDIAKNPKAGTPVEIVDPAISERRGREWKELAHRMGQEVGWKTGFSFHYATKASPTAEIVSAALNAGWNLETSSEQDITNITWLGENGYLPKGVRIYANGYKPDPQKFFVPEQHKGTAQSKLFFEGEVRHAEAIKGKTYVDQVSAMRKKGIDIVPIIDSEDELSWLTDTRRTPQMEIGVRFKTYGLAKPGATLDHLVSRHGLDWETMVSVARNVQKSKHLSLTTFHAMIGAAETIDVDTFVSSLLQAGRAYFELKKQFPQLPLHRFNMGGGVPPLSVAYDHEGFVKKVLTGFQKLGREYRMDTPQFEFEFGSYIAAESGFALMGFLNQKVNHTEKNGMQVPWLITNYSLLRGLIDMKVIGARFIVLPVNYANLPGAWYRIGDMTCDSDGKFLTDTKSIENGVFLPKVTPRLDGSTDLMAVAINMGAYQEFLTGLGGVGHSGQGESRDFVVWRDTSGVHLHGQFHQGYDQARRTLGYTRDLVGTLRRKP